MAVVSKKHQEAREALLRGVTELAELVTITLGPKGRNVMLDRLWSDPRIVHDGVSIAKEIELPDHFENMGAAVVREAASKTADTAGDGTTTSTLLAWKLIDRGMRLVEEGVNPMLLKEGMDKAVQQVVHTLASTARQVEAGDIEKVATISAANAELGKLIALALERVGKDGIVTAETGMGQETTIEYKDGMQFDKGYTSGSPTFVTDKDEMVVEITNPMILYTDMVIDSLQDFTDFLDHVLTEEDRNLVVIAEKLEGYTLPLLIDNHQRGHIRTYAVQAPSFGIKRLWMLEDMATLTGGIVVTRQSGRTLASIKKEELGRAEKVWADADNTRIIGGQGKKEAIASRIAGLKQQVEKEDSEFEKEQLRQRIARMSGGVAIVKVGALTEAELNDKKERINDAVEATKSALAEGIVAGGGIALLQCQSSLRHLQDEETQDDIKRGVKLVLDVLDEPFKKILQNAGETPEIVKNEIAEKKNCGYNIVTKEYGDMFEMGVVDPVKVTRKAIESAVSVASMLLTTDALVTKADEDRKSPLEKNATSTL